MSDDYYEEPSYYLNLKCDRCGEQVIHCGDCGGAHCDVCIHTFDLEELADLAPFDEQREEAPHEPPR